MTPAAIGALLAELPQGLDHTLVLNKWDLVDLADRALTLPVPAVCVSALTGEGLEALRSALQRAAGLGEEASTTIIARRRHLDALARAQAHLDEGILQWTHGRASELLAEELRQAQLALGEITGQVSSDELLGEIFSSFCLGK